MASNIDKYKMWCSPLSQRVLLGRFGKDEAVALETKDFMNEFLQTLIQFAYVGESKLPPVGAIAQREFGNDEEKFRVTVERINVEDASE